MKAMRRGARNWSRRLDRATWYLAVVGGLCLFAILAIVSVGVVMRYAFGTPLLGANEIVQLTAVGLVMTSLPYCTSRDGHVAVDVFEDSLGRWGRFAGDILSRALAGSVLAILCHRAVLKSLDALEWGDATNMLQMPIWPFYAILAAGAGLCSVVFALQIVLLLLRGAE